MQYLLHFAQSAYLSSYISNYQYNTLMHKHKKTELFSPVNILIISIINIYFASSSAIFAASSSPRKFFPTISPFALMRKLDGMVRTL